MTTNEIIAKANEIGIISEKEINLIKNRINKGDQEAKEAMREMRDYFCLEGAHEKKGFNYLYNLYMTPRGKERKNHRYGYREIAVLECAKREGYYFTFDGFYDTGNRYSTFNVPIYTLCTNNGTFEYYVSGGEVNIIG